MNSDHCSHLACIDDYLSWLSTHDEELLIETLANLGFSIAEWKAEFNGFIEAGV